MSSIMRARGGLTRRSERLESIGGSSLEEKVTGPSTLGIGCPDRHALPLTASPITHGGDARPPARAGSFTCPSADIAHAAMLAALSQFVACPTRRRSTADSAQCPVPIGAQLDRRV